ncbi:unnamed protein product, partial [Mesorhabditis spiculigera]
MGTLQKQSEEDGNLYTLFFTIASPFSNFYPCRFPVRLASGHSHEFTCVEQYYMYMKALTAGDQQTASRILIEHNPRNIKKMGSEIQGLDSSVWKIRSPTVMTQALTAKYKGDQQLRRLLFLTMGSSLAEASPSDTNWGIGLALDNADAFKPSRWRGKNGLGVIMTMVRNALWEDREFSEDREFAEEVMQKPDFFTDYFSVSDPRYSNCDRLETSAQRPFRNPLGTYTAVGSAYQTPELSAGRGGILEKALSKTERPEKRRRERSRSRSRSRDRKSKRRSSRDRSSHRSSKRRHDDDSPHRRSKKRREASPPSRSSKRERIVYDDSEETPRRRKDHDEEPRPSSRSSRRREEGKSSARVSKHDRDNVNPTTSAIVVLPPAPETLPPPKHQPIVFDLPEETKLLQKKRLQGLFRQSKRERGIETKTEQPEAVDASAAMLAYNYEQTYIPLPNPNDPPPPPPPPVANPGHKLKISLKALIASQVQDNQSIGKKKKRTSF